MFLRPIGDMLAVLFLSINDDFETNGNVNKYYD